MNSIGQECQELKEKYDVCFFNWFKDGFLQGSKEDKCASVFQVYQDCVKKAIKTQGIELWQIEKDVLGTPSEKQPPPPGEHDTK